MEQYVVARLKNGVKEYWVDIHERFSPDRSKARIYTSRAKAEDIADAYFNEFVEKA